MDDGAARPILRLNKPADAGTPPLVWQARQRLSIDMRERTAEMAKKTRAYKARRGRIARRCGSQSGFKIWEKKERNIRARDDVDDHSWDGKKADENLMPHARTVVT